MIIKSDKVILRPIKDSDIQNYIHWTNVETEWKKWDAPWEWESEKDDMEFLDRIKNLLGKAPSDSRLMIQTHDGIHLGSVNSYFIENNREKLAVGIGILPVAERRKGYAFSALTAYMKHHFKTRDAIYTQTWAGNYRMIALAEKIGFQEYRRIKDLRVIDGKTYDALTFKITKEEFYKKID